METPAPDLKAVFDQAVEIISVADREAFLTAACAGDSDFRQRVEALFSALNQAGSFLEKPHPEVASEEGTAAYVSPVDKQSADLVGVVIAGKYKLLQLVGEGGMGAVYMADQLQPVKRRVAVKLIRTERGNSKTILSRFEAERQAIALMDHPNIAKLLDAGTIDDTTQAHGRPSVGLGASVGFGCPYFVMELVKGISLTEYCDDHRLSIMERLNLFTQICSAVQHAHQKGIIHRDLKPTNILVESHDDKPVPKVIDFGLAKATSGLQLTEHTLFTALGIVAGTLQYMAPEQAKFNAIDIDTRADIYSLGVILYELLTGTTPIERETLKQAAIEEILRVVREQEAPTPSKRLSSTDSKPSVAANRQSEPAKLGRFVRGELDWIVMKALSKERDRRYETANGFAKDIERFINHEAVLAGPPSARYRLRKFVQRNRSQVIAASLILLALLAGITGTTIGLIRSEQQRKKAERAEAETLEAYKASTDDAIEQLIGSKPELGPQERIYLERTRERWQTFANRQGDDERSRTIRGEGHFRVASLWQNLGRTEEARAEYQAARDIWKKLVEQFPAVPEYQQNLARTHNNLGNLLNNLGKRDEARAELDAAHGILKNLADLFPAVPKHQQELAVTHLNLGILLTGLGKLEEALAECQAARDLHKKLVDQFPSVTPYHLELAGTHNSLGIVYASLGKHEEARAEYQAARDLQKKLVEQFPYAPAYHRRLSSTHNNLGLLLAGLGKGEEARAEYQAARDIKKKLVEQFPSVTPYQHDLANTHNNLGNLLVVLGKREDAREEYQAARDIWKKLVGQFPAVLEYQIDLGGSYGNYGRLIRDEGKLAESLAWFDLDIRILQPVYDKEPRDVYAKLYLRNGYLDRARTYDRLLKAAEAVKDWDRAIELSSQAEQAGFRASRATSRLQADQVAEAVAEVAELTAPVADATGSPKWNAIQWYDFACVYAVASSKIADKKQEYADRAMELLQKAVKAGWKDAAHMAKDTDLDPLREREDFKKLMAELEKKK